MATTLINCFDVQRWDGGERTVHECYVTDKVSASNIAGMHGSVVEKTFIIHDNQDDYNDFKNGEVKKRALAKLSDIELAALGLKR